MDPAAIDPGHPRSRHTAVRRLRAMANGPLPRLPGPLDDVAEAWWGLPTRVRLLATAVVVALVVLGLTLRSSTSPWGRPTTVVVAARAAAPGDPLVATTTTWPADLVPADALTTPRDGIANRAVRAGEVLTRADVAGDLSHLLTTDEVAMTISGAPPGLPATAHLVLLGTDFDGVGRRLGGARLLSRDDETTWVAVDRGVAPAVAAALSTGQVTVAVAPGQ